MAKGQVLGRCECPECGFSDAEIKLQKSGLVYRWCPDCCAQYFPRTKESSDRLRSKHGINLAGTDTEKTQGAEQFTPEEIKEAAKQKSSGNKYLDMMGMGG
jgi:predicted  nucleic acid-binding Zn-ribbon protein